MRAWVYKAGVWNEECSPHGYFVCDNWLVLIEAAACTTLATEPLIVHKILFWVS